MLKHTDISFGATDAATTTVQFDSNSMRTEGLKYFNVLRNCKDKREVGVVHILKYAFTDFWII